MPTAISILLYVQHISLLASERISLTNMLYSCILCDNYVGFACLVLICSFRLWAPHPENFFRNLIFVIFLTCLINSTNDAISSSDNLSIVLGVSLALEHLHYN